MKKIFLILCLFIISCKPSGKEKAKENVIKIEVYDFDGLQNQLEKRDNKIHVVNFWATWCGPCVKELPHFEKILENYKRQNVDVLLVSLDFPNQYNAKLKPFLKEHKIKSKVVALDDVAMDTWIPKVDSDWSGALPATLIYKNGFRKFYEKSFTYEELEKEIQQFLK